MSGITVFQAKKIVTMDPNLPEATHVAVRGGRILAVGGAGCADQWGACTRDDRLAGGVLMPGFVEGHAHLIEGGIWDYAYAGYFERTDPNGRVWPASKSLGDLIATLSQRNSELPDGAPLVAWGFDPIYLNEERLGRAHLDQVSSTRPIAVLFSNMHLMCVNSAALELAGFDQDTQAEGVVKDGQGAPTGELQEMAAMFPVMRRLKIDFRALSQRESAIRAYGAAARRAGVTTVTDLYAQIEGSDLETLVRVTSDPDYPVRLVPALGVAGGQAEDAAGLVRQLAESSTEKLRLGAVKLMTDGSIQGWTARVNWPGYVGGQPNGIWNTAPDQIRTLCDVMHRERIQMHIHVNGDEAADVAIDAIESAMARHGWAGHGHVLQHGQMMTPAHFRRCARLGISVNLFANHLWYFGDQHAALTIGEDRARRMNAARSALDAGLCLGIHSDAPITPLAPLFTAWCAVNRVTASGRILGASQRITVAEAMRAITLGAAETLKLDAEIGSIETGKRADFVLLDADPFEVGAEHLRDIAVKATVLGGRVHLG
ncbi:amidohydrolase [Leisingera sp. ANG59]|uniref:amidohydrolase n=1 Tax=Leisingera sp. ANG59 TaxID=2675221 RepID=UPI001574DB53|nr:amidohydrolase [Leisingera sp. ANG59]NSY41339.1 amidohydrolase family protein [Leisingera sp. ANG59]